MFFKYLSTLLAGGLMAHGVSLQAQTYPSRPVRVIMTVGAGADLMARLIGDRVGNAIGQPLVAEIQSAAGGSIGAEMTARAAPDGHTLMLTAAFSHVVRPFLAKNTPYDPVRDFTPLAQVAGTISAAAAHPSLAANNMTELVELARRQPCKIAYGRSGVGTSGHLTGELLKLLTGAELLHVPYKSGSQSVSDLVGGQIPLAIVSLSPLVAQVRAGKLKLLAMVTAQRFRVFPDVATVGEQIRGFEPPPAWSGYFGPAKMPEPVVQRLSAEINKAMADAEVKEKLEAIGFVILQPNTPSEFAATIRRDLESVGKIVKSAKIQPE
jgi:tripartite-type tricarboxylate transporter receptor subunit TctC